MSAANSALTPAELQRVDRVDLQVAVLCQDCQFITASTDETCALCGSRSTLQLAPVLNRNAAESEKSNG